MTTAAPSSPCLRMTKSVLFLLFRNLPEWHGFPPHFCVMSHLRAEPPPIVIHVILLIRSQSPYGGVAPITLLSPADLGERRPSSQPKTVPSLERSPKQWFLGSLLCELYLSNHNRLIRIFRVLLKRLSVKKKGGDIYFPFIYVKCTMYAALAHVSINARLTRHFLLFLLIRVERARLHLCWNKTPNFT